MLEYIENHSLEIFTTVLGLIYLYFEYRASIWLWLLGIVMPAIDVYLFATNSLYAYAGISLLFSLIAIYGVFSWKYGGENRVEREISLIKKKVALLYMALLMVVCAAVYVILVRYTDSTVPFLDSFTTAASFIGVIALAYKYVEQWLVWILVDIISVILFIEQGLPFRACLYGFYVLVAIQGYRKWKQMVPQTL